MKIKSERLKTKWEWNWKTFVVSMVIQNIKNNNQEDSD
jgi:hypothetical protein